MRNLTVTIAMLMSTIAAMASAPGDARADERSAPVAPGVTLYDAGGPRPSAFGCEEVANRAGWKRVPDRATPMPGDVCVANAHLALVLRRECGGAELYAARPSGGWFQACTLWPRISDGARARRIAGITVHVNDPDRIELDASFAPENGRETNVRFLLRADRRSLECEGRDAAVRLVVDAGARFAVIPDGLGDDLVVNPARIRAGEVRLPGERLLLLACGDGDALVQCVWPSREQRVRARLAGDGEARAVAGAEIELLPDRCAGVAVGVLAGPEIWHGVRIGDLAGDARGTRLDWKMPFDAEWRVDFRRREDGLIDSWSPTRKAADGNWEHCRENGSRTMWTSCRDDVAYPAYIDGGALWLLNVEFPNALRHGFFRGADDLTFDPDDFAVVYPFARVPGTPSSAATVTDLMRQALEGTPEFGAADRLSPVEMARHRFPATCFVTQLVERAFEERGEQARRAALLIELRRMDHFVLTKRERIEEYMDWMRALRLDLARLASRRSVPGELARRLDDFFARMEDVYSKGRGANMQHPPDYLALREQLARLIDAPGEPVARLKAAQDLGKKIRTIGGAQDGVLGALRQIVKELRQTAGYAMFDAADDGVFAYLRVARDRTVDLLWQTCSHEWR